MHNGVDTDLAEAIRDELDHDARVTDRLTGVDILARAGQVVLEGEVPDIATKRIVANTARALADDGTAVDDRLRLAAQSVDDDELARQVTEQLSAEEAFRNCVIVLHQQWRAQIMQQPRGANCGIEVRVRQGVVTLAGRISSLNHRRLAEVLCWWVPGCSRVDNYLDTSPEEPDTDSLLTDAVRIVLEKDPMLDPAGLAAAAGAGIVELRGIMPDEEAHRLALRDVWAIPGVWDVYDRLRTGESA